MKITFATGNKGKVASMHKYLEDYNNIEVEQKELDLIEPQLDSITDIALHKARQAFDILKKPVIVEDTGFCIEALNGFPGPYAKYILDTLSIDHILKMMDGEENRNACFHSALVYIDKDGKAHVFEDKTNVTMTTKADTAPLNDEAWSELWRIIILEGSSKTLNSLNNKERKDLKTKREKNSRFVHFAQWISDAKNAPISNN